MFLDEMIDKLADLAKAERPDVVAGLRETFDPQWGTFDGHWASQLENVILDLLSRFSEPDKIEAYNELADAEGLGRVDADQQNIDLWIHESFMDPVLERLFKTDRFNGSVDMGKRDD